MNGNIWSQIKGHVEVKDKLSLMLQKSRLPHCSLFVGVPGIGKKQMALALAQHAVCEKAGDTACGQCGSCTRIKTLQSEDLLLISPEKQSIKLSQAKAVNEFLSLAQTGRSRFVIIDGADQLNPQAANSLLKLIEEPPENSYFILIAPSPQSVLPTIRSRSQWLRFSTLSRSDLKEILPAESWMYEACQGSVEVLKSLTESEVSSKRLDYLLLLEDLLFGKAENEKLFEVFKDREEALFVIRVWGQALHDALVFSLRFESVIHKDQQDIIKNLRSRGEDILHRMNEALRQLEKDILGNLDRSLAIEALKIKAEYGFN